MHQKSRTKTAAAMLRSIAREPLRATLPACLLTVLATPVWAMQIETDDPDLKVRWDTTVGYSLGFRTKAPSAKLTQGVSAAGNNDGDLNFSDRSKPITNRVDLFTEADVTYRNIGARISAAAWYDDAYQHGTANTARLGNTGPFNQATTLDNGQQGQFPDATRRLHGNYSEILDAFVFGKTELGSVPVSARLGRHALTWGETLFFGANGIAGVMSPFDVIKLQSAPNSTVKETTRPVNQISGQAVIARGVSVSAYYQLEFEKSRSAGSGSYYNVLDALDTGGSRTLVPTPTGVAAYTRGPNLAPPDSGQGGISTNFSLPNSGVDLGLYAIQYHSKAPGAYGFFAFNGPLPTYQVFYAQKIRAYAASFSATALDNVTFAGEAGIRTNAPLARGLLILPQGLKGIADGGDNAFYAAGNTGHVNLSTIVAMQPNFVSREAILTAEFAWNRVLSCSTNCGVIPANTYGRGTSAVTFRDGNSERDAYGFRVLYVPTYRQVFPGVDLSVPVGLSYSPRGKSGAVGQLFVDKGGDISVGLTATVRSNTTLSLRYTHYYGPEALPLNTSGFLNYGQALKDRNNVTLSARFSF